MNLNTETMGVGAAGHRLSWVAARNVRRLSLLRKAGLFDGSAGIAQISRACKLPDLIEAYRLAYATFLESGYIQPNAWGMRIRAFEACAETATFLAKKENRVVGVLSLVLDSQDLGLPSDVCYPRELESLRSKGAKLCEGSNQATLPMFRKTTVATDLMRCGVAEALSQGCDGIIVTVNPPHCGFYELLGFQKMGDVRSYASTHYDPVVMMYLDLARFKSRDASLEPYQRFVCDFLSFKNPFVSNVRQWQRQASECFYDAHLLRTMFVLESDLLETCTDLQRRAIRRRWGKDLYAQVAGTVAAETTHAQGGYISEGGRKNDNSRHGKRIDAKSRKTPKNLYGQPSILPITSNSKAKCPSSHIQ